MLPTELSFFQEHFQEGPRTYRFLRNISYRFSANNQRLLIHNGEDQWDLYFYTPTDEEFKHLVETIMQCDSLRGEMHLERNGLTSWEEMFPEEDYGEE